MMRYSAVATKLLADKINSVECLKDLNQLILSEGCTENMPFFTQGEVVLDMDCVESKLAQNEHRNNNKSMDSAIVVTDSDGVNHEILLIEYRFNYVNMKNLDKSELIGKVSGSINALADNAKYIHNKYVYIFNTSLKQQAIRRFRDMVPSMPNHYIATDIQDLKSTFF